MSASNTPEAIANVLGLGARYLPVPSKDGKSVTVRFALSEIGTDEFLIQVHKVTEWKAAVAPWTLSDDSKGTTVTSSLTWLSKLKALWIRWRDAARKQELAKMRAEYFSPEAINQRLQATQTSSDQVVATNAARQ